MSMVTGITSLIKGADESVSISNNPIKVLIVDDHPGVRAGIKKLLAGAKDIVVMGEGTNGADALELINTKKSDLLLLDIELPDQRGDIVMHRIHEVQPEMKVLAVSSYSDREYILGMVSNGAVGYITKDEAPAMLLDAIRSIVKDGKDWFSPHAIKNSNLTPLDEQILTEREISVLNQLVLDQPREKMAASLQMEQKQLEKYLMLLMKKFETESMDVLKHTARRILSRRQS